jgi:AcrR family transcriptional regulator
VPQISDEQRETMRRRLIDAAVTVVLERGTEKATTREILKEAGLSAGALYHYFPSKEALYEEVARYQVGVDGDEAPDFDALAPEQLMLLLVVAVATMFDPDRRSITPLLRAAAVHQPAVAEGMRRYDDALIQQVGALNRAAVKAGLYRPDVDGNALTEVFGVFVEGYGLRTPLRAFAADRREVMRLFLEMVCERLLDPQGELFEEFRTNLLAIPDTFGADPAP